MKPSSAVRTLIGAVLGSILLITATVTVAGVTYYRWLDDRGNPVHSDRPPPKGTEYEVISTGSEFKRVVTAEEGAVPPETTPRVGNEFAPANAAGNDTAKKNPEICRRAQANLDALSVSQGRITMRNEQGEVVELSAEEIAKQTEQNQALVDQHC